MTQTCKEFVTTKDENVVRCPYCDRPYYPTLGTDGKVWFMIIHTSKCPITFNEDAQVKAELKEGTLK